MQLAGAADQRWEPGARALALVLNPEPASRTISAVPGQLWEAFGARAGFRRPLAGRRQKLGRVDATGPSTGHAAGLFYSILFFA